MTAQVPGKPKAKPRKAPAGRSAARHPTNKKPTATSTKRPAHRSPSKAAPRLRGADRRVPFKLELSAGWALVGEVSQGKVRARLEHSPPVVRAA